MRIGYDANPMVGDMGGVGWHSYHLLRTMSAQQGGIDFVAYARPGADRPDSLGAWPGIERVQWVNSSRWGMGKRAALFVGNDSGAMHIAAAVGTPMVALFGPSNPSEWGHMATR